MKIILDQEEVKTLERNAGEFSVEPEKLYDMYKKIMASNLEQDLWDILNENLEELGGRDYEQEEYDKNSEWGKMRGE